MESADWKTAMLYAHAILVILALIVLCTTPAQLVHVKMGQHVPKLNTVTTVNVRKDIRAKTAMFWIFVSITHVLMAEIAQTQVLTIIAPALQHSWVEIVIIRITVLDILATDTEFAIQLKPGLIVYAMMVSLERSAMNWTFVLSSRAVVMGFVNAMDPITFASAIEDIMEKIAILLITVMRILANLANVVKMAQDICVTVMRDSKGFTVMK